jgi:hypothetical protein
MFKEILRVLTRFETSEFSENDMALGLLLLETKWNVLIYLGLGVQK